MIPSLHQISILPSLLRHPRASREELLRFQSRQLRRVIANAYDKVPYYRRLFDQAGVYPGEIRTAADLARIPITTRRDLQKLPLEDRLARDVDPARLLIQPTSGSSGEPLVVRRTWWEQRVLGILRFRALQQCGVRFNDKLALVAFSAGQSPRKTAVQEFIAAMQLIKVHEIHSLLPAEAILAALEKIQPDILSGYPSSLAMLSKFVSSSGHPSIHPRLIISGAEVLTPLAAQQISEAFRAPVYDTYGSHEFGGIANPCNTTGGYHVFDDGVVLEVLRDGRPVAPGGQGTVVGTSLHAFAMPFIRYQLGDVVTRGSEGCACGQPFSTLSEIQGRMIDYFPLPDGRSLHPYEMLKVFRSDAYAWMYQYQVVQERRDRIVLRYVPRRRPSPDEENQVREGFIKLLGPGVDFALDGVDRMESEKNGKFQLYRSLVSSAREPGAAMQAAGERFNASP
ncbi:MAG: phenylacetate--CoA ligase family protein [Gemmatimonadaceae bacterium]|nr:phenylacetate--CoA ligase family protein [Gemmatimonadaceae bacterium]MDQ3519899.1 hypothetical protein [Gemmatimonadota bacterium]